jgi:hypothetical protein
MNPPANLKEAKAQGLMLLEKNDYQGAMRTLEPFLTAELLRSEIDAAIALVQVMSKPGVSRMRSLIERLPNE